jgi:hypothetical protein
MPFPAGAPRNAFALRCPDGGTIAIDDRIWWDEGVAVG